MILNDYSLFDWIGKIGVFGDLRFSILNTLNILSPQNGLSISKSSKYEQHSPLKGLDYLEFQKRNLTQVTFQIKIVTTDLMGIRAKLNRMVENGEHYPLLVGYDSISNVDSHFVIIDFKESKKHTDGRGNSLTSEFDISFLEYQINIERGESYSENISQQGTEEKTEEKINENNSKTYEELEGGRLW